MTKPTGNPRGRPRKIVQDARSVTHGDGWNNVLTNIGNRRDPVSATQFGFATMLDRRTLAAMYRGDGLAKRIVDIQVEEAIREWIEADDLLLAELGRLNAKQDVTEALKWARLFGGALVVALVDDGQDFDQPVNMNGIRSVRQLRVYDRHRVTFTTGDVDMDAMSPTFGKPLFYAVQGTTGVPYRVHNSRCWRIDGLPLPDEERQLNNGWGDSAIMASYEALRAYGQTMGASANIVRDFVQVVLGIRGLTDMLRQGEDALVAARANVIDLTRSVANTVFLDADGETYDKKASSVAGLADLWDRFALHVSTVTGIPATKLLGRSPAGMNATGESDMRQWYDVVQAYRGDEVEPLLRWLVGLIEAQSDWTDRPDEMDWTWPSLYQPTEAEWADVKLKIAQADAVYLDRGAADPEYLYHLRYSGAFRPDAHYDFEEAAEWMAGREPQA